jgi:hypothetical protein
MEAAQDFIAAAAKRALQVREPSEAIEETTSAVTQPLAAVGDVSRLEAAKKQRTDQVEQVLRHSMPEFWAEWVKNLAKEDHAPPKQRQQHQQTEADLETGEHEGEAPAAA